MNKLSKITNEFLSYENQWVALIENQSKVIASGASIKILEKKLKNLKEKNIVLSYILPFNRYYSPNVTL